MADPDIQALEVRILLDAVFDLYGYDFRDYAPVSLARRILARVRAEGLETVSGLQERVLHDPACMERLLCGIAVNVTAMFRDPSFYALLRQEVVALLRTYPRVRIWIAGCSTGEEAYSLAIVLHEEDLLRNCTIYATDLSDAVLRRAQEGLYPLAVMRGYTQNYQQAGGKTSFSDYYTANYKQALLRPHLREKITFARHNLVTDASFNVFNLIMCRNVLIYFSKPLQDRVHGLLHESLERHGILALGRKESLRFTPYASCYEEIAGAERLYLRVT